MKTMSVYMTVRVDVSFPAEMSEEDVVAGMENLNDYEIRLDAGPGIEVDCVEICGINE